MAPEGKLVLQTAMTDFDMSVLDMSSSGFAQGMKDFGGGGLERISFAGKNFNIVSGGNRQVIMNGQAPASWLDLIIIDMAPDRHCVWYKKDYDPRNPATDIPPDAVWWYKQGPGPGVPDYVTTTKRNKDGMEVNYYQMNLRLAVALVEYAPSGQASIDYNKLYAMDISGMSLFSKDEKHPYYTFSGLMKFCRSQQTFPNTFVIRMVFAPNLSVPAVRFIPNIDTQSGKLLKLDPAVINGLITLAQSEETKNILDVPMRDPLDEKQSPPVQPQGAPVAPQPAPAQPQPTAKNMGSPFQLVQDPNIPQIDSATADLLSEADKLLSQMEGKDTSTTPVNNISPDMAAGLDELLKGI